MFSALERQGFSIWGAAARGPFTEPTMDEVRKNYKTALRSLVLLVTGLSVIAGGCRSNSVQAPEQAATRQATDDLGRSVTLPVKIERAISLAPSVTEMIFAAGAGDRLVGVTTYCNYPPETAAIAKVGDTQTPNMETIVALRPQVVFVSTASQLEAFMKTLEQQKIAVYVTDPKDIEGVLRGLAAFGDLFGTRDDAANVIRGLRERAERVTHAVPQEKRPRVFLQISEDPLYTIGKDSYLTKLIEAAGGESATKDIATAYPTLSKETALALDPEIIILSDSDDNKKPNRVFDNSPAVRNGRVLRINADILARPGPRLVDALEQMAKGIHPERETK